MNKKVLVTGSGSRIGKAIALFFAEQGFDVCVHYCKNKSGAEDTVLKIQELGQKAKAFQADFRNFQKSARNIRWMMFLEKKEGFKIDSSWPKVLERMALFRWWDKVKKGKDSDIYMESSRKVLKGKRCICLWEGLKWTRNRDCPLHGDKRKIILNSVDHNMQPIKERIGKVVKIR